MDNLTKLDEHTFTLNNRGTLDASIDTSKTVVGSSNKFTLAVDCDEILVDINNKWFNLVMLDPVLSQLVPTKIVKEFYKTGIDFNMRPTYYLFEILGIDKEKSPEMYKRCQNLYYQSHSFYDDLEPSDYFQSLYNSAEYIEKIHVITACGDLSAPVNQSKKRFLAKAFSKFPSDIQYEFHFLGDGTSKGSYIKEKGIVFNSYAEDTTYNICNVIENTNFSFEVLMPLYGYNVDLANKIKQLDPSLFKNRNVPVHLFHNLKTMTQSQVQEYIIRSFHKENHEIVNAMSA